MNIVDINKNAKSLVDAAWKDSSKWNRNYNKAKSLLEEALIHHPDDETCLINYGTILCDMGHHSEAAIYFNRAIEQGTKDKHAFLNLGIALINFDTHDNAIIYMNRSKLREAGALTWEAYFDPMAH